MASKDKRPKESRRKPKPATLAGAKQANHPNLKAGENFGDTGAGPKPRFVRERLLRIGNDGLDYYERVAKGEAVILVPSDLPNVPDGVRKPSHRERKEVIESALQHGLPTKVEFAVSDDAVFQALGTILPEFVAPEQIPAFLARLKSVLGDES